MAWSVKVSIGVELPDHYHIGRAMLITQPLPDEPAYLSLQMTVAGLGSEVTLHMRWLAGLHKVFKKSFGIEIDKHLGKCHCGSTHNLGWYSSLSLSHDGEVDNRSQKPQQITANETNPQQQNEPTNMTTNGARSHNNTRESRLPTPQNKYGSNNSKTNTHDPTERADNQEATEKKNGKPQKSER